MSRDRSGDSIDSTREDSIMCKLGSSALATPMQVMPDPRPPALHEFLTPRSVCRYCATPLRSEITIPDLPSSFRTCGSWSIDWDFCNITQRMAMAALFGRCLHSFSCVGILLLQLCRYLIASVVASSFIPSPLDGSFCFALGWSGLAVVAWKAGQQQCKLLTGWAVESWEKLMVTNGVYLNECQNYLPIYDE